MSFAVRWIKKLRRPSQTSLSTRLLITLSALLAIGLLLCSLAAMAALRSYLLGQVDNDLQDARSEVLRRAADPTNPFYNSATSISLSDFYVEVRNADGSANATTSSYLEPDYAHAPSLSRDIVNGYANGVPFTVTSQGDENYRYRAVIVQPSSESQMLVLAQPIENVTRTIDRLIGIDTLAILVILSLLLLSAYYLIRRDLAPLEEMTETAGAIAAGDLSQRVNYSDGHTEVGQLGMALNAMLSQIEASFAERQATEDRLRRFAADASHELRTPITAIRGYAELHRQGAISDPEHLGRVMQRIESESSRMGSMVEDLLLLARLDQGRPFELDTVEINRIVSNVVSDFQVIAPERSITDDEQEGPLYVEGDSSRLHQIFTNLIANAVAHTPPDATISVTTRAIDDMIEIAISDTGQGMEPDAASKVFERFYRIDEGRARSAGGTGLGLAIVDSLVRAHGGYVDLKTAPGQGSTFTVKLPKVSRDFTDSVQ